MRDVLNTQVHELVESIRQWSHSQLELWQKIPNLALESDRGYSLAEDFRRCYRLGFWALDSNSTSQAFRTLGVDCENGDIVHGSFRFGLRPAEDLDILEITRNFDLLDATKIIDALRASIDRPFPPWFTHARYDELDNNRVIMRQKHNLGYGIPYVRPNPVVVE